MNVCLLVVAHAWHYANSLCEPSVSITTLQTRNSSPFYRWEKCRPQRRGLLEDSQGWGEAGMISQAAHLQSHPLVATHCLLACVLSSLARWESWAHIVHCRVERTRRPSSHESIPPGSPKRPIVGFSSGRLRLWAELNHIEEKGCLLGKIVLFSSYMLLALKSWRRCLIVEV